MPHPAFVGGQELPASDLNLLVVRDTYTPEVTADTTSPTLGTFPTQDGQVWVTGSLIYVEFNIVFGTGPTAGSGPYRISLPAAYPIDSQSRTALGTVHLRDVSVPNDFNRYLVRHTADGTMVRMQTEAGVEVAANIPFTWAAGDILRGSLVYLTSE